MIGRALVPLVLVGLCVGCSSTTRNPPVGSSIGGEPLTGDSVTSSVSQPTELADLVDRDWVVSRATGVGRDPTTFPAHLRFTVDGEHRGSLTVSGCAVGTLPVTFGPQHEIRVATTEGLGVCANPFDVGQAIPNVLELPLRWSVDGNELTLTPTSPSPYSLVLTDVGSAGSLVFVPAAVCGDAGETKTVELANLDKLPALAGSYMNVTDEAGRVLFVLYAGATGANLQLPGTTVAPVGESELEPGEHRTVTVKLPPDPGRYRGVGISSTSPDLVLDIATGNCPSS